MTAIAHDGSIRDPRTLERITNELAGAFGMEETEPRVKFYEHAVRDQKREREQQQRIEAGAEEIARPFFKVADYVEIRFPDVKDYISRPVKDEDRRTYPQQWAAYQARKERGGSRTELAVLPEMGAVEQAICDHLRLTYIEDLIEYVEQQPQILDIFGELHTILDSAKRWRSFRKPRMKLVNGELKEA